MFSIFDSDKITGLVHSVALQTLVLAELRACKTKQECAKKGRKQWQEFLKSVLVPKCLLYDTGP